MRNHNGDKNFSIMWMMLICMVPLVVLLFAGGKLFSAGYLWPILIGTLVVVHLWMMFKGHGGDTEEDGGKGKHQRGGGCH